MGKILTITSKILSLRGRMTISDEAGRDIFEAKGEFSLLHPRFRISRIGQQVAVIRRKLLSFMPIWRISSVLGDFVLKRKFKLISFTRTYHVVGGPYDGATISGNFWDLKFELNHGNKVIARAAGKILSLRDRHTIEIVDTNNHAEVFTAIVMVALLTDRSNEGSAGGSD